MLFAVYHISRDGFREIGSCATATAENLLPIISGFSYTPVALVDATGVDHAYFMTNHIETDWTTNRNIWHVFGEKQRSTSIGDIIVDQSGNAQICCTFGWESVPSFRLRHVDQWYNAWEIPKVRLQAPAQ